MNKVGDIIKSGGEYHIIRKTVNGEAVEYMKLEDFIMNAHFIEIDGEPMTIREYVDKLYYKALIDFEPYVEYCDIHEAFEWMKKGKHCKFKNRTYCLDLESKLCVLSSRFMTCEFSRDMLTEKKWIKL